MTARSSAMALFTSTILLLGSRAAFGQEVGGLTVPAGGNGVSQRAEVSQWVGPVKISIEYHSPAVHRGTVDRTGHIWGDLVPYGFFDDGHGPSTATPWRAGANESTTITLSHGVKIEGHDLAAGTYALFLEVEHERPSTWIFSRHLGWGSYQYDAQDDALRVPARTSDAPFTEFLTYGFDLRRPNGTLAFLQWENRRIAFEIGVPDVNDIWVAQMRQELQGWPGFESENWRLAAQFCANNRINLDEALVWADKAIREPFRGAGIPRVDFLTLQTKAAVLRALGRDAEAVAVMDRALKLPETPALLLYSYGNSLLGAKQTERALEVFQQNARQHPDEPYWTHLGFARYYTAAGDKARAIAEWTVTIRNTPTSEKANLPSYQAALTAVSGGR